MTTTVPVPPFTIEQIRSMSRDERLYVYETYPEEFDRVTRAAAEAERARTVAVGYWRPLKVYDGTSLETIDGPDSPALLSAIQDIEDCRAGRYVSPYVSDRDMRAAGVESLEGYLEHRVAKERAKAEAEYALPLPVADSLSEEQAAALADWLEGGREVASYRGSSTCRVCGCRNGAAELERDGYRYPSGLAHYVREHRVAVPGLEFVVDLRHSPDVHRATDVVAVLIANFIGGAHKVVLHPQVFASSSHLRAFALTSGLPELGTSSPYEVPHSGWNGGCRDVSVPDYHSYTGFRAFVTEPSFWLYDGWEEHIQRLLDAQRTLTEQVSVQVETCVLASEITCRALRPTLDQRGIHVALIASPVLSPDRSHAHALRVW